MLDTGKQNRINNQNGDNYTEIHNNQMKVFAALLALTGLATCQDWELEQTGLCIERMASCPSRKQRYGVCCKIRGVPTEFDNYCLACNAGCDEWKYKKFANDRCS